MMCSSPCALHQALFAIYSFKGVYAVFSFYQLTGGEIFSQCTRCKSIYELLTHRTDIH